MTSINANAHWQIQSLRSRRMGGEPRKGRSSAWGKGALQQQSFDGNSTSTKKAVLAFFFIARLTTTCVCVVLLRGFHWKFHVWSVTICGYNLLHIGLEWVMCEKFIVYKLYLYKQVNYSCDLSFQDTMLYLKIHKKSYH